MFGLLTNFQSLSWDITGAPSSNQMTGNLCILRRLGMNTNPVTSDAYFSLQNIIANGSVLTGTSFFPNTGGQSVTIGGQPSIFIDSSLASDSNLSGLPVMMHEAQHHAHYVVDILGPNLQPNASTYQVEAAVAAAIAAAESNISRIDCCTSSGKIITVSFSRLQQIKSDCGVGPGPCDGK